MLSSLWLTLRELKGTSFFFSGLSASISSTGSLFLPFLGFLKVFFFSSWKFGMFATKLRGVDLLFFEIFHSNEWFLCFNFLLFSVSLTAERVLLMCWLRTNSVFSFLFFCSSFISWNIGLVLFVDIIGLVEWEIDIFILWCIRV